MCRYPGDCQPGLTRVATARNCTSVARPQEAARNRVQIVRRAPDWWRLPRSPLDPSSLRRGFAVSDMLRAAAEHDVAWEEAERMSAGEVHARLFPECG